jgi:hypothetical protein
MVSKNSRKVVVIIYLIFHGSRLSQRLPTGALVSRVIQRRLGPNADPSGTGRQGQGHHLAIAMDEGKIQTQFQFNYSKGFSFAFLDHSTIIPSSLLPPNQEYDSVKHPNRYKQSCPQFVRSQRTSLSPNQRA